MSNHLKHFANLFTQRIFVNSFINNPRIGINYRNYSDLTKDKNLRKAINSFFNSGKSRNKFGAVELLQFEKLLSEEIEPLDIKSFSKCFYSLRIYEFNEIKNILPPLTKQCSKLKQSFGAQAVGNTLYGLRNMNSDSSEVRAVLVELGKKIAECKDH